MSCAKALGQDTVSLKEHLGVYGARAAGREARVVDPIISGSAGQRCEHDEPLEGFRQGNNLRRQL